MIKVYLYKNGTPLPNVKPIFGDDLKLTIERESGEMYRRTKMDGDIVFIKNGYATIHSATLDDEFKIRVQDEADNGTITRLCEAKFTKVDCTFDTDNEICTITPKSADNYDRILASIDKEYNLIDLCPPRTDVDITKRPLLQFYMLGDNKLTNVQGNVYYEVDAQEINDESAMTSTYRFANLYRFMAFSLVFTNDSYKQLYPLAEGNYYAEFVDENTIFRNENGYYFKGIKLWTALRLRLYDPNGNIIPNIYLEKQSTGYYESLEVVVRPSASQSGVNVGDAVLSKKFVYGRVMYDTSVGLHYDVPAEDIVTNTLNYRYCEPIDVNEFRNRVVYSFDVQDAPTKWGVDGNGKYFTPPITRNHGGSILAWHNIIPIGWSKWIPMSFWLDYDTSADTFYENYADKWTLRDAIKISDAIQTLLKEIDPSIEFKGNDVYSEFLYDYHNPIGQRVDTSEICITPITNIKKTYYDMAAKKGDITLRQIFDFFKNLMQCYWFLEQDPNDATKQRLRIEHIEYFRNGGTYTSGTTTPLYDLTALKSPKMGLSVDYCQNTFTYDSGRLSSREEFSWASDCTEPFKGWAIDIRNKFCRDANKNSNSIPFLSDIDYIMAVPNQIGDDLYAIFDTKMVGDRRSTWLQEVGGATITYNLQNPTLSVLYCANSNNHSIWKYNLSGDDAYMATMPLRKADPTIPDKPFWTTGAPLSVVSTMRIKQQEVEFPIGLGSIGAEGIIRTSIGDGEWVKMTIELFSQHATATLLFDTE